jgi:MFS family permease
LWSINFFFASCGASAAYLTVGESFPLEVRARAIGIFYAFGTALGGITGPLVFGTLIESGQRSDVFLGYVIGGVLMVFAGAVEIWLGVNAERQSLENVAPPLSIFNPPLEGGSKNSKNFSGRGPASTSRL